MNVNSRNSKDETNEFEDDDRSFANNIKLIRARSTSIFKGKIEVSYPNFNFSGLKELRLRMSYIYDQLLLLKK